MTEPTMSKHDHVLAGLVFQLQAVAMQQLGKLQDPHTGETSRDLEGARHTIDLDNVGTVYLLLGGDPSESGELTLVVEHGEHHHEGHP